MRLTRKRMAQLIEEQYKATEWNEYLKPLCTEIECLPLREKWCKHWNRLNAVQQQFSIYYYLDIKASHPDCNSLVTMTRLLSLHLFVRGE